MTFRGDDKGQFVSKADRQKAGEVLLRWSRTYDLQKEQAGVRWLSVQCACKFLSKVPAEWLLEQVRTQNIGAKKRSCRASRQGPAGCPGGSILLAAFELKRSETEQHRPWTFGEAAEKAREHLLDYSLETVCASADGLLDERPNDVLTAIAAYIDAVCNAKHLRALRDPIPSLLSRSEDMSERQCEKLFRTGDLTEDICSIWFWANDQHPDTHHKLCSAILRVLSKVATTEEGAEMLKLRDSLFATSNLIVFRTLVAEALYRQREQERPWHLMHGLTSCKIGACTSPLVCPSGYNGACGHGSVTLALMTRIES